MRSNTTLKPTPILDTISAIFSSINRFFRHFYHPARKRTSFEDNITASLALPEPAKPKMLLCETEIKQPSKKCNSLDELRLQEVELVSKQIIEHAQRRADLFFYLLIAIYKKFVVLNKDETVKQHGKGNPLYGTNACHSSLFPNFKLTEMPTENISEFLAKGHTFFCPILDGTHFGETLNMTVELPRVVNVFDMHLEGKVHNPSTEVKGLTDILNKVSLGALTPQEGMGRFYEVMHKFFNDFETEDCKKVAVDTPITIKKIGAYQREGTFKGATKEHNKMTDEYFCMLMRIKPEDVKWKRNSSDAFDHYVEKKTLEKYYLQIQSEIYSSKAVKKMRKHPSAHPKLANKNDPSKSKKNDLYSNYRVSYKL